MERTGALKIYFGYAEGVGKTQAMLQEARDAKTRGKDVAAGCIEIRRHEGTQELLQGLEVIGSMKMAGQEPDGGDLDLDQILERRPQIFLVDDLAHVNAEGSRHARRYQDVKELLTAGIEVWTTLNVQELESLNDVVVSIAGRETTERIPDEIFELAQEVVLVDCEPSRLMKRVSDNDICGVGQRRYGGADFYTIEKLTSFREIAMLRCADRLDKRRRQEELDRGKTTIGKDHILVCLSSSPSNARIIRIASRMAEAYHASLTALFVETTDYPAWPEKDKERLRFNIHLAEQLGATVETVHGEDVPYQIIEFARMSGVSKVVVGRSRKGKRTLFRQPLLTEELIQKAPNLGVYIIPDYVQESYHEKRSLQRTNLIVSLRDIGISVLVLLLTTLLGFGFAGWGFSEANIITIYILGVLVISVITSGRAYSIAASAVSVLVFNFFFTDPKLTFRAYDKSYPVTFLVMFLASFITGSLATKMKNHAKQAAQAAFRTQTLFDTNQLLQQAEGKEEIIEAAAGQIKKLLGMDVIVYPAENGELQNPQIFPVAERLKDPACVSKEEAEVAEWVYRNNRHAGATTDTWSHAKCLYLAIRVNAHVYGVVGITVGEEELDSFEHSVLLSNLGECALALENDQNAREKKEAAVMAKNEQLRANILRAISHDLRTPLTSISGNASNLVSNSESFTEEMKQAIYKDIYEDSMWLIDLVENLLAISKIDEGRLNIQKSSELMDEVISEALRYLERRKRGHIIEVHSTEEFLLAKIDARLIVQVIINLVDNAIKYTPEGSVIRILTKKQGKEVIVRIEDDGPGISDEAKNHIFEMFYTGGNQAVDGRRSLGLGLALCQSIINAHGGEISVSDVKPHGTAFTFTLPAGEVELHE